ncbi:MAG: SpoIIE family protein phosphatase [Acidobacteriota bacterium]
MSRTLAVTRRHIVLNTLAALVALSGLVAWIADLQLGGLGVVLRVVFLLLAMIACLWATRRILRWFLWRVSRRLAFSYFLIGLVPIPLVLLLTVVGLYILSGFFLGHLYRDAAAALHHDLEVAASHELAALFGRPTEERPELVDAGFAIYREGTRIAGDERAPATWSDAWPEAAQAATPDAVPFFDDTSGLPDAQPALMAAAVSGDWAVVAVFAGDLERELSERSGIWVELERPHEDTRDDGLVLQIGAREIPFEILEPRADKAAILDFFEVDSATLSFADRPWLVWLELARPFLDADSGDQAGESLAVTLTATPRAVVWSLVPASAEVGAAVYLLFFVLFLFTFDIYLVALGMALFMIFSLSRAVNRLSEATRRIQRGDFSTRIDVKRRDQVGALQRSFNAMAENLEELVATAAQKEIWERELMIAQELQRSLLPESLEADPHDAPGGLRFASYFRPSTAIGGDYYDLVHLADGRLAIAVADVSGHGLAAGLRMAMVKSALEVLCEEEHEPRRILERLHGLLRDRLRGSSRRRSFVTATLAAFDPERGELELANAGHPPTYLLRRGEAREIVLESSPLGALGNDFAVLRLELEPGDSLIWLSDGLIEATDRDGEVFGYARVLDALDGQGDQPDEIKHALLESVGDHFASGGALDDDLTVVVMTWDGPSAALDAEDSVVHVA